MPVPAAALPALHELLEAAYALFAPYTIGSTLRVCKACCVSEAEERELVTTPLRQVSGELLQYAYFDSVCYHSDQERWEMKHFLPRVLELVSQFEFPRFSPEIMFDRLDLDQPAHWPRPERELLAAFALAYFERCLAVYPLPTGDALADILLMFGLAHFAMTPLLRAWATTNTLASLGHLTDLLLEGIDYTPPNPLKLQSAFSQPYVDQQLAAWLSDQDVRATLVAQVEHAVLHQQLPAALATRASWACEVLLNGLP